MCTMRKQTVKTMKKTAERMNMVKKTTKTSVKSTGRATHPSLPGIDSSIK